MVFAARWHAVRTFGRRAALVIACQVQDAAASSGGGKIASSKKVIIGGRLDRDPEIHTFEGGDRVARAVDRDNGAMNQRQYAPGKDRLAHCSLVQESTGHIDRPE